MSISASPPDASICDTTAVRYFALVDQFDLLAQTVGGTVRVPPQVLDLAEDPDGIESLGSEIAKSARYWSKRARDPEATQRWSRLRSLWARQDIDVVDLSETELHRFSELTSTLWAKSRGLAAPLGDGEAAVIAVVEDRRWEAIMDDGPARELLKELVPDAAIATTRDILRRGVAQGHVDSAGAQIIYSDMRAERYKGPDELWP